MERHQIAARYAGEGGGGEGGGGRGGGGGDRKTMRI